MNSNQKIDRVLGRVLGSLLLALPLAGSLACAGSSTVALPNSLGRGAPAGTASLAPSSGAAPETLPAVDRAASAVAVQAVEKALPRLRGVAPDEQLRTLRWMLSVGDDSRLVFLFDDLRDAREEPLERRAATARQRLEELAGDLERAGHRAPEPDSEVARIDPNAPAPNYFPPSMIQDLERRKNADPEAARALEEALRTSPRGSRPPGR
jgi:hypothetical protein